MRWVGDSDDNTSQKQRVNRLLIRLRDGPDSLSKNPELVDDYNLWLEMWVVPELQKLFKKYKFKTPRAQRDESQQRGGE